MSNKLVVCACSQCSAEVPHGRTLHRKTVLKHLASDRNLVHEITGKSVSLETISRINRCIESTLERLYEPEIIANSPAHGKLTKLLKI